MDKLKASDPTSIGPYKVIERLGGGGMAEVFVVENPGLHGSFGRRLALKRILPGFQSDDSFRRQFADEAKLAGRLHHPSIVSFLDSGEEDGVYYLVMELVVGTDLGRLKRHLREAGSRLPMSLTIYIAQRVAAALAYAHPSPHCVVHRDVSPQNILLGVYGEVKLADFGIARHAARDQTRSDHAKLKGKLAFMSPEQIGWPERVDGRSDLFPLGIVLFEMITGRHPFLTDLPDEQWEEQAIVWRMMHGAPAPRLLGVEPELGDLVERLLERDADLRPSAEETLRVLQDLPQRRAPEELLSKYIRASLEAAGREGRGVAVATGAAARADLGAVTETVNREVDRERRAPAPSPPKLTLARRTADQGPTVTIAPVEATSISKSPPELPREPAVSSGSSAGSAQPTAATSSTPRAERPRRPFVVVGWVLGGSIVAVLIALALRTSAVPRAGSREAPRALPSAAPVREPVAAVSAPREATKAAGAATEAQAPAQDTTAPRTSAPLPLPPPSSPAASLAASEPADSKRARSARLFVAVIPWGQVWVDGEAKGEAPVTIDELPPGAHRIQVGQGEPQKTFRVRLSPGSNDFTYELEQAR
jgi:serine/threonine protein kinase